MKNPIKKLREWAEDGLRGLCGKLSPEKRFITIIVIVVVFALANFYITFRAIYNIGREDAHGKPPKTEQVEIPDFDLKNATPTELEQGFEAFFEKHFNEEENDTTDIRTEEAER